MCWFWVAEAHPKTGTHPKITSPVHYVFAPALVSPEECILTCIWCWEGCGNATNATCPIHLVATGVLEYLFCSCLDLTQRLSRVPELPYSAATSSHIWSCCVLAQQFIHLDQQIVWFGKFLKTAFPLIMGILWHPSEIWSEFLNTTGSLSLCYIHIYIKIQNCSLITSEYLSEKQMRNEE